MMKKLLTAFLFAAAVVVLGSQAEAQAVVVVHPSVKTSEVSRNDLRDIFSGNSSTLKDGARVTPVLLKQGTVHEEFLSQFIGKSDSAFRAGWRSLVFSGQASMPRTFDSESALIDYVASTPGAVGYVGKSANRDKVKTLSVK